jgi:hypothetical protein
MVKVRKNIHVQWTESFLPDGMDVISLLMVSDTAAYHKQRIVIVFLTAEE